MKPFSCAEFPPVRIVKYLNWIPIRFLRYFFVLCGIQLLTLSELYTQENNYWVQQVGVRASLLGGAVTAGVRDNSAIFYNPGALGYIQNSNISVVSDIYTVAWQNIENGAGEGLDIKSNRFYTTPQIVAGLVKHKKISFAVNYAVMNRHISDVRFKVRNEIRGDIVEEIPSEEIYLGTYDYRNLIRDDWLGIGFGYLINEHLGIGLSSFFNLRSQDYFQRLENTLIGIDTLIGFESTLAKYTLTDEMTFTHLGLTFIAGLNYQKDNLQIGVSITSPRMKLGLVSFADFRRNNTYISDNLLPTAPTYSVIYDKVKTRYHTPWVLDAGFEYDFKRYSFSFRMGIHSKVNKYDMVNSSSAKDSVYVIIGNKDVNLNNIYMAHTPVVNFAIGFQQQLSEKSWFLYGFRTDFNYMDFSIYNSDEDFMPTKTYWNMYHINFGWGYNIGNNVLTIGFGYSFGRSSGDPQFINMTEPDLENFLLGPINNNTTTRHNQVTAVVGFIYNFKGEVKKAG